MRRLLLLLLAITSFSVNVAAQVITPVEAGDHIGEVVTVQGIVSDVGYSERSETVFLNFGGKYPNHAFTAVIFRSALTTFPQARTWLGRTLRVTGRVRVYRGKPEVVLSRANQVLVQP